nr:head GIN domain-containing protein [uncultured Devosia sp.]
MRNTVAIMAAAAGLLVSTAAYAESKTYELSGFDKIDVATGLDAVVKLGDSFSVTATSGSAQALESLQLEVTDGVLLARFDQSFLDFIISGGLVGMLLSSGNALTIEVTLPAISAIEASSGADVRGQGLASDQLILNASSGANIDVTDARLGTVRIGASSGADVDIAGTADAVEAEASSGAGIDAENLVAAGATVNASSGASISVHATASINAEASSGGDVDVSGNPTARNIDASSGGDVNFDD